ncbi:hypothetical protein [Mycobacterium montefiorense]|uniref:Antitoxin Xre/MbcA/ParS-like toxin-binding domain-containing protein n=1 Tax=Mycobacterium montefiorense TaxID=154654 RepID=A0AA37UY25_9MYCO|nr:hypothetical protein [Mycobacterium montefiorense]GBG40660.1 hypothetical protein MmonteBS_50320 [Mycobacterium montefiorense]GKU33359.1 hypothetical protein NJB14191_07060 [Mycobacterium montefiorense]GKU41713.1 hypothetical protein NJB14192_36970 [Mycobacterium montefiorense]GKU44843.1 hypothetical protein NJB14194_14670 [Mycobacterium montefiorense]GKU52137.1 hypothetical protein NJB14195_33810 [Mycobacterium montefiorense]
MTPTVAELDAANRRLRESAHAVGVALSSVTVHTEPAVARAVQAELNLYARIETEFGMLTSTEAGKRMGSRSSAPRNLATTARRNKTLVAVRQGNYLSYPGFQFGPDGKPLAVIARLLAIADDSGWSDAGLVQWLCSPTTYLDGDRPVDHLVTDPDRVVAVAGEALAVSW